MAHIHLDLVGGLAGDMFISALLDCYPDLGESLPGVIAAAGFTDLVTLASEPANDGVLTGTRFHVTAAADASGHHHRHYAEIRKIIEGSDLAIRTREHALGIFHEIAVVEAEIHGKTVAEVAFHEVGAWDSIADVLCAAHLITLLDATWSVSRIPLGRGRVRTAHGPLPVPAPATARLLEGFEFVDDGIDGERVTPTGAAILKHLAPIGVPRGARLTKSGYGFGSKTFPGISNVVRALVFETNAQAQWATDQVLEIAFEVDDMTPEALAVAVARLRDVTGIRDVTQEALAGKKGRQAMGVRILAEPAAETEVTRQCFIHTTTLGVRRSLTERAILRRHSLVVPYEGRDYRVKIAERPTGITAKVEMDDLAAQGGEAAVIEQLAIAAWQTDKQEDS